MELMTDLSYKSEVMDIAADAPTAVKSAAQLWRLAQAQSHELPRSLSAPAEPAEAAARFGTLTLAGAGVAAGAAGLHVTAADPL